MKRDGHRDQEEGLEPLLNQIGLSVETIEVVRQENRTETTLRLRVLLPRGEDGLSLEPVLTLAEEERHHGELLPRAAALVRLWCNASDPRRRHMRRLGPLSLWRTPSLKSLRRQLPSDRLPEVIQYLSQDDASLSEEELLERALYPQPTSLAQAEETAYESFSTHFLLDIGDLFESLNSGGIAQELRPQVDPGYYTDLSEEARQIQLAKRWEAAVAKAWPEVLRSVMKEAERTDQRQAAMLEPLRSSAEQLLLELDGGPWEACEQEAQPGGRIDALLGDAIQTLRAASVESNDWWDQTATQLQSIRCEGTAGEKVGILLGICQEFPSRTHLSQALLREADVAPSFILGQAAKAIYRKIRRYLTPPERRLFFLMYMPEWRGLGTSGRLPFNGLAFMQLPLRQVMFLDEELLNLAVGVVVLRDRSSGTEANAQTLRRRYRRILAFYSWWVRTIREEDKMRKRQERQKGRELQFKDSYPPENVESPGSRELHQLIEQSRGERQEELDIDKYFERGIQAAERRGVLKRHGIARLYFVGGLSELETARHIGTSQQNVSKALHEFLKRDFRAVLPPDESQILDRILGQGRFLARGRRARRGQ